MKCVILAGGLGSRFWPYSRKNRPKQLLNILGEKSMLQITVDRLKKIKKISEIYIITRKELYSSIIKEIKGINKKNVIIEPSGKNTAPAIGMMASYLALENPDDIMCVFPADHYIVGHRKFSKAITSADLLAKKGDNIVTIGLKPSYPSTAYGYIQYDENNRLDKMEAFQVKAFAEKPHKKLAERFIKSGDFLWNSGIFIWSAKAITLSLRKHLRDLYDRFEDGNNYYNTNEEVEFINRIFPGCKNISIDYGLLEKAENVFVYPSEFGWSDLGTWGSLYDHLKLDINKNGIIGDNVMVYNSKNNIINAPNEKVVIVQGLEDYIIIDNENTLLICKKEDEQQIKRFVNDIKRNKGDEYV